MSKKILTKSQRDKLLIAHKRTKGKRFSDIIKAILLLDDGMSFAEVSKVLFIDDKTARNYKKTYDEDGLYHLIKDNYTQSVLIFLGNLKRFGYICRF